MADFHNHEPLTRADLAGLTQSVLQATAVHRDDVQTSLVQARAEIRAEAANLGEIIRNELSQARHDLTTRLEAAVLRLGSIVEERDHRIIAVLLVSQLAVVVILSIAFRLLTL